MAKKIAVFDTNPEDAKMTAAVIRAYYERAKQTAEILAYTESYPFVCAVWGGGFDMAFLAMNSPVNLETARKICRENSAFPVFFVSAIPDYALEAHRLMALDYLIKPVTLDCVAEAIGRIDTPYAGRDRRSL